MTLKDRLEVLDIWVDPVDEAEAVRRIEEFIDKGGRPHSVFAVNPEKNFSVPADPSLYEVFKQADLLIPDGIGIVVALRLLYGIKVTRTAGFETMKNICALAARKGAGVFLYGAKEEVNKTAAQKLLEKYPGIKIKGRANGYVKETEMAELVETINRSGAQILFLALGSPRQENWFKRYKNQLDHVRVCQGVGGSFDVIAGNVIRSPDIWIRFNLEWLYRLLAEPSRFKRQMVLPVFAFKLILKKLNIR